MPAEGDTQTVTAYGISEKQEFRNGTWGPAKQNGQTVTAYGISEKQEFRNGTWGPAKQNGQTVTAYGLTEKIGGTTVQTTKTSYTKAEKDRARAEVGTKADASTFGAKLQENRASQSGGSQAKQQEATRNAQLAVSEKATKAGLINASKQGGSKGEWCLKLAGSMGASVTNTVNSANKTAGTINEGLDSFSGWTINFASQLQNTSMHVSEGINGVTNQVVGGISGATEDAVSAIQGWKTAMHESLKPISYATGSTLGSLTQIARNPLGAPQLLGNAMMHMVDKLSPDLANKMDASFKTLQIENLANLPGQVMGSIRSLACAADAILSVPFTIASDIYNGLMEIMMELGKMVDELMGALMDFIFGPGGLLDSIFPIAAILELLEAVGELASFVGGISQLAGGFNAVTNIASQVGNFASSASSMVSNPMQLAQAYIPGFSSATGAIGQVTGALRDPQQLMNQLLPPGITQAMNNISNIPGLGFVGSMGGGIGGTLDALKGGVFNRALDQFESKLSILGPLFNKSTGKEKGPVDTQEAHSTEYEQSKITGGSTAKGITQIGDTSKYKVFKLPDKLQQNIDNQSTLNQLAGPAPTKTWLDNKTYNNNSSGPTIQNAKNMLPITPPKGTEYKIQGGTVTIPSSFSINP